MLDGLVHIQPLRGGLLSRNDYVDVIPAGSWPRANKRQFAVAIRKKEAHPYSELLNRGIVILCTRYCTRDALRDRDFFIRPNDTHRDRRAIHGDNRRVRCIASAVEVDADKVQAGANAAPYFRSVLADSSAKDESIQPAKCRGEPSNRLFDLVAKH